ncbi:hypothetical protein Tco_1067041 [Tanacetum coccineum]|uniref:Uncharacterized protein n=1 Tax=Tanacetum coccineum TaxID=301880 RepID=A0ABQ5HCL3_9ASTR
MTFSSTTFPSADETETSAPAPDALPLAFDVPLAESIQGTKHLFYLQIKSLRSSTFCELLPLYLSGVGLKPHKSKKHSGIPPDRETLLEEGPEQSCSYDEAVRLGAGSFSNTPQYTKERR